MAQITNLTFPRYNGDTLVYSATVELNVKDSIWTEVSRKIYFSHFQDSLPSVNLNKHDNKYLFELLNLSDKIKNTKTTKDAYTSRFISCLNKHKTLPFSVFYTWNEQEKCWDAKMQNEIHFDTITNSTTSIEYHWDIDKSEWISELRIEKSFDKESNVKTEIISFWVEKEQSWLPKSKIENKMDSKNRIIAVQNSFYNKNKKQWILTQSKKTNNY